MSSTNLTLASMLGARQHYQPLAMISRAGLLSRFITDGWNKWAGTGMASNCSFLPKCFLRASGRWHQDIPTNRVVSFNWFGAQYRIKQNLTKGRTSLYSVFENEGRRFATRACRYLDVEHSTYFGYSSACLETIRVEKKNGIRCVVDQIDPARVEHQLVQEEERQFPDLVHAQQQIPDSYFERLSSEWNESDQIIVNSEWSRTALLAQGVSHQKIAIVPLPYTPPESASPGIKRRAPKLRVLWLGTLDLRKGLPYALQAAKELEREPIAFTFAGPTSIRSENLNFPPNCTYLGQVPRVLVPELYSRHDLFLLPTLSDGFAITQLEAMAFGLPVICTPNCGEVVEHGRSGLRIPARDARALADAIRVFSADRGLLETYSAEAVTRAKAFAPDNLWPLYHRALYGSNEQNNAE